MILGKTVFEIFEELIWCRTNEHGEAYRNSAFRLRTVDRNITRGKPRAGRFAVSTDVRCTSPEKGILAMLIFAVLYD